MILTGETRMKRGKICPSATLCSTDIIWTGALSNQCTVHTQALFGLNVITTVITGTQMYARSVPLQRAAFVGHREKGSVKC
jgi:hypothetical protein